MNPKHEALLTSITEEFPERVEEFKEYEGIPAPVNEEYLHELCGDNEVLIELLDDMILYFYRYTIDYCQQESLKKKGIEENHERINELEAPRSALHDAMIESVKILARNLNAAGKDTSWFDPIDKKSRAGYGQLALLTTFHDIWKSYKTPQTS